LKSKTRFFWAKMEYIKKHRGKQKAKYAIPTRDVEMGHYCNKLEAFSELVKVNCMFSPKASC
jgi:hypothetical protein